MCGLLGGPSVWQEEELGVRIPARNINNVSPHFHWDEMMRRIILVLLIIVVIMIMEVIVLHNSEFEKSPQ